MNKKTIQNEFFSIQRRMKTDAINPNYGEHQVFCAKIKSLPPELLSEAFLEIYQLQKEFKYQFYDQTFAGGYLWFIKPKSDFDLEKSILEVIPFWDVSAKELPKYYEKNFGTKAFLAQLKYLSKQPSNLLDYKMKIDTLAYWTGLDDESLDQKWNSIFKKKTG